jgi:predicted ribosomally synthesized peptide with SipW-like signal peptide
LPKYASNGTTILTYEVAEEAAYGFYQKSVTKTTTPGYEKYTFINAPKGMISITKVDTVCKLIEGGGLDRFAEIAPKSYRFDKGKVKRTEGVNLTKKLIRTAQVAILVMLLGTLIVGETLAYLTASKDKINTITVGKVEVVIEEPGVNNNSVEWGINSKPVYLTATNDSIDGVVRAMIIPEFLNENGEYINCPGAAQNAPVSNKIVMGDITFVALDNYAIQNGYALDFS